jgi:hypothetical protein
MPVQEFTTEELEFEEWRPVVGFETSYVVSSLGRVERIVKRYKHQDRFMKQFMADRGYYHVCLYGADKVKNVAVHRVVLLSFQPPPTTDHQVNHIDGIKTNNRLNNLEWVTPTENIRHAVLMGLYPQGVKHKWHGKPEHVRGENNVTSKLTKTGVIDIRRRYAQGGISTYALAAEYGVTRGCISNVIKRKSWFYVD